MSDKRRLSLRGEIEERLSGLSSEVNRPKVDGLLARLPAGECCSHIQGMTEQLPDLPNCLGSQ